MAWNGILVMRLGDWEPTWARSLFIYFWQDKSEGAHAPVPVAVGAVNFFLFLCAWPYFYSSILDWHSIHPTQMFPIPIMRLLQHNLWIKVYNVGAQVKRNLSNQGDQHVLIPRHLNLTNGHRPMVRALNKDVGTCFRTHTHIRIWCRSNQ